MELIPTKLPHYILPLAPAGALLVAFGLMRGSLATPTGRWHKGFLALLFIVPAVLAIAQIFLSVSLMGGLLPLGLLFLAAAALLGGWVWWGEIRQANGSRLLVGALSAALLTHIGVFSFTVPSLSPLWLSGRVAGIIAGDGRCENGQAVAVGYHEPSLRFLLDRGLLLRRVAGIENAFALPGCRHLVVTGQRKDATLDMLAKFGIVPDLVARTTGVKLNGGQSVELWVYRYVR